MNRLVIIGAGGHGKVIADNGLKNGYTDICFVDDDATGACIGFPIIGKTTDIEHLNDGQSDFIIGVGDNSVRRKIAEKYDVNWVSLVHPSAQIAFNATVGKGTVIMANAVVNACAIVGCHCIINTCAVVEHDNVIKNFVHISPSAKLGGSVSVGESTHVGIGATISNNISVSGFCMIGAGALVIRDITESGTYVGVSVRKIK